MKFISIILIIIVLNLAKIYSQTTIKGIVTDAKTKETIAFANIIYNNKKQGTTTGIDGKFNIESDNTITKLEISFLGYQNKTIDISTTKNKYNIIIKLQPVAYNIDEVTVLPGINPAHRIINNVIKNKNINNPEKMQSFEYTSYNKMVFTFDMDGIDTNNSLDNGSTHRDSTIMNIKDFKDSQYLMMTESVSKRKFKFPDKNNEKVIASRVSGLENPSFVLLATQIQSMSFYSTYINILDKNYLSPISGRSNHKYFFLIEDTLYNKSNDTIFVISFRPHKGKNFDGLKGILNINSNKYAIQSVQAEPYEQENSIKIRIQQKYSFIHNKQWFPMQLNIDITFKNLLDVGSSDKPLSFDVVAFGKSYIKDIKLLPKFEKRSFNHIVQEIEDNATEKPNSFWNIYRQDTLTNKEQKTYHIIDSLGKAEHFDQKLELLTNLFNGYIPWGFINFDYTKIINYNEFEGFSLGLGIETNPKLFKYVKLGGYGRYGFRDYQWKYGGHILVNINKLNQINLKLSYFNDIKESGGFEFYGKKNNLLSASSTEYFRNYLIKDMFYTEALKISIEHRIFRYLKAEYSFKYSEDLITNNYSFANIIEHNKEPYLYVNKNFYTNNEATIKLKYAYKEKFTKSQYGLISMGTKYPIVYFNAIFGINNFTGDYSYKKYEAMITKKFLIKNLGQSSITINAGYTNSNIPYIYLYNGHGSFYNFTIEASNSFGTMRINEFLSDEFVSVYLRHDFKSLLFKKKWFQPKFVVVTNLGYGKLKHTKNHKNISYKTMEKGYYESGLLINNILKQSFSSIGVGVFYRYGPYTFDKIENNFAYKLSFYYSL